MRRLFRFLGRLVMFGVGLVVVAVAAVAGLVYLDAGDLPDHRQLAAYEPPTATRIHGGDGSLLAEYAREKRVFVPVEAMPDRLKQAFIAAEDQNFYRHFGVDPVGVIRAAIDNIQRAKENKRPQGASTITQQVAKNFLLSNELSFERKIKEAVLALRIEEAFTKDKILELYLNEIFLGNRSYGVAAAALNYFDKSLDELSLGEMAFLGGLPKAPASYDPRKNMDTALERRNYVLQRMQEDGYITPAEAEAARQEPLQVKDQTATEIASADFFVEEVRRQLVDRLGEAGFYEGGLSVRTTLSADMQAMADEALRRGLVKFDRNHAYRGPWGNIDLKAAGKEWPAALAAQDPGFELRSWRTGVVLSGKGGVEVGLADGSRIALDGNDVRWASRRQALKPGDLVLVEPQDGGGWSLRQRPVVEGAVVAMDPHTGRVLAMSGGFSFRQSKFNRATQAWRQPGSSFKPFVYLAALENGYTPSSIVLDAPISIDQGPGKPPWRPENYSERYYGPTTLRVGLEKSRNVMTVRLAQAIGIDAVIDVAHRFGIDQRMERHLAAALGTQEVTVLRLATAYAQLVNGGRQLEPYLVEEIQDRHGRIVMRRETRPCDGCNAAWADGALPPPLPDNRPEIVDPRIAFQVVNILEGVIERGTAEEALSLGRPLAGKTGTTNDAKDAWFVGFSPDLVIAVWIGYDQPASLGDQATGAKLALPIWMDVMAKATEGERPIPFRTPPGVLLVRVDAASGRLASGDGKDIIAEAYLPGTEPVRRAETDVGDGIYRPNGPNGLGVTGASGGGIY
ncbi:MAG: penicillin-binding protein 1A [Geminicoccaceae bacterium]